MVSLAVSHFKDTIYLREPMQRRTQLPNNLVSCSEKNKKIAV